MRPCGPSPPVAPRLDLRSDAARGAAHAALVLLVASVLVFAKGRSLVFLLEHRWLLYAGVALFVATVALLWRALQAPGAPALLVGLVVGLVLTASAANTPLRHEMAALADDELPLPEGHEHKEVEAQRPHRAGDGRATVRAWYPAGTSVDALADATRETLSAHGWHVRTFVPPGTDPDRFGAAGLVMADDGPFAASCVVGPDEGEARPRVLCTLLV